MIQPPQAALVPSTDIAGGSIDQQRLLTVLALAQRHRLPVAQWVMHLASEIGGGYGNALRQFAANLSVGIPVVDALEQLPGVLPTDDVTMLRLAQETGTLPQTYSMLAERSAPIASPAIFSPIRQSFNAVIVIFITLNMLLFQATFIWPTMQVMTEEFELPLLEKGNSPMRFLIDTMPWIVWALLASLIAVVGLLAFAWRGRGPGRRWYHDPAGPSGHSDRRRGVLSMLALVISAGRPASAAVATLARFHPVESVRQSLVRAGQSINAGGEVWGSLVSEGLLSENHAQTLSIAATPATQADLLMHISKSHRAPLRWSMMHWIQLVMFLILMSIAALVALASIAMFAWLSGLARSLA